MNVQIFCFRICKLALNHHFEVSALDDLPARHHPRGIKAAHGQRALTELVRYLVNGIERFFAATSLDGKPHTVGRGHGVMLVVDEDQFVAGPGVGQADAARPRTVGDPPNGTMRGKLGFGYGKKMIELAGLQPANAKIHK